MVLAYRDKRLSLAFLVLLTAVTLYLTFIIARPFITPILTAILIAIAIYPAVCPPARLHSESLGSSFACDIFCSCRYCSAGGFHREHAGP